MTDNHFAPPRADVATQRPPARPPLRSLQVCGVLALALCGFVTFHSAENGLWAIAGALVMATLIFAIPFAIAAVVGGVVWATRLGSPPDAFWATVKVMSWVVGVLVVLIGLVVVGLQVADPP